MRQILKRIVETLVVYLETAFMHLELQCLFCQAG